MELLLLHHQPESAVVFCNTKKEVQNVNDELSHRGFSVIELHGDMEQRERDQALVQFSNKTISILVATDVAARGLDVDNLDAVFNFELSRDPEVHVHRIGRTGRAGSKGVAISFFSEKDFPEFGKRKILYRAPGEVDMLPVISQTEAIGLVTHSTFNKFAQGLNVKALPMPFGAPEHGLSMVWHPSRNSDSAHQWLRNQIAKIASTVNK